MGVPKELNRSFQTSTEEPPLIKIEKLAENSYQVFSFISTRLTDMQENLQSLIDMTEPPAESSPHKNDEDNTPLEAHNLNCLPSV